MLIPSTVYSKYTSRWTCSLIDHCRTAEQKNNINEEFWGNSGSQNGSFARVCTLPVSLSLPNLPLSLCLQLTSLSLQSISLSTISLSQQPISLSLKSLSLYNLSLFPYSFALPLSLPLHHPVHFPAEETVLMGSHC